jgi:hypothetical protein
MSHRSFQRSGHARGLRRFSLPVALVVAACLVLGLSAIAAGCGGGSSDATTTSAAAAGTSATAGGTATSAGGTTQDPKALGETIAATWAEAIQKLNAMLADVPDVTDVQDKVQALSDEYTAKMNAYAEQLKSLDSAGQTEAASARDAVLTADAKADWYSTYQEIYDAYSYMSGDVNFVNLVGSFSGLVAK